ncbi:MAG: hypothetical protein II393_02215 [Cytophagales bacterium]|nr:hypothetical protein [Cytophagales bacterium]
MTKQKKIRAVQAQLNLMIPEADLNKIKKLKNPMKSKVFRTYAELLLGVIKGIDINDINQ